jgi:hypothetical protein
VRACVPKPNPPTLPSPSPPPPLLPAPVVKPAHEGNSKDFEKALKERRVVGRPKQVRGKKGDDGGVDGLRRGGVGRWGGDGGGAGAGLAPACCARLLPTADSGKPCPRRVTRCPLFGDFSGTRPSTSATCGVTAPPVSPDNTAQAAGQTRALPLQARFPCLWPFNQPGQRAPKRSSR